MRRLKFARYPMRHHAPLAPERVISMLMRALHAPSTCKAYINATSAPSSTHCPCPSPTPTTRAHDPRPLTAPRQPLIMPRQPLTAPHQLVDRKFDQVHSDLFLCLDSIFAICFSIRNLDMPGDEISRLIHVFFYGDNFSLWSQAMRNYLKGYKLWIYVSSDRSILEKVNK